MLPQHVIYYGEDRPLPPQTKLTAGPVTAIYDNGDLRYIRYGNHEVIRRLYAAVRDHNWGTVPPILNDVSIAQHDDGFEVRYSATHRDEATGCDFVWNGAIEGDADGRITFHFDGTPYTDFKRNRIGFCVLHPMDLAGRAITIEHPDELVDEGVFPSDVEPHQPFMDIVAIRHPVTDGVTAEIRFKGDVFEMEDQRNWTDASYKTYCTPLAQPFPVTVKAGEKIEQRVTLTFDGDAKTAETAGIDATFDIDHTRATLLPKIGLGMASHGKPLAEQEIERLRALKLNHLRVDVREADNLDMAHEQSRALGCALEIAVHLGDNANEELTAIANKLRSLQPHIDAIMVFHGDEKSTDSKWVELAREKLGDFGAPIGAGTDAFFTELNRGRPEDDSRDFSTFSTNPQVHAFEVIDIVETLEAHAAIVDTAVNFNHGKPVRVSPVTFKMRWNPNATGPFPPTPPGELPPQVDPRQMSLFGAGWTAGSLKYLARPGVESITYYETTGWRGVMEIAEGSPSDKFPSLSGSVFPMYHVFENLGKMVGGKIAASVSSAPLLFDGVVLHFDNRQRVLLASFSDEPQTVTVRGITGTVVIKELHAENAEQAMTNPKAYHDETGLMANTQNNTLPVKLDPFAIVCIDGDIQ